MPLLPLIQSLAATMIAVGSALLLYLFCQPSSVSRTSRIALGSLSLILAAMAIGRVSELGWWGIEWPWLAAISDLVVGLAILWRIAVLWPDRARVIQSAKVLREGDGPAGSIAEIADSVSRYRSLFGSAGLGIALRDATSGAVIDCNPRYLEIIGRRHQSLLRYGGQEWTKPEFIETESRYRDRLINREIPGYELTKQIVLPDGSCRWVRVWAALANGGSKTMDILADVDQEMRASIERDRSLAQLEFLNRELEGFAYACAHDLKSPLRRIRQRLQMALGMTGDEQANKIREAIRMGDRLNEFIEQLLEYSRLDQDSDLTMMAISVSEIARSVACQYEDEARFQISAELPDVRGNLSQIERLFGNLYSNAVKYGGEGVVITVAGRVEGHFAEIDVSDNGPGVDASLAHTLFQLFVRGEDSTGAGLGLAICQKIVTSHGGRIALVPSVDGACFRIHLPLV